MRPVSFKNKTTPQREKRKGDFVQKVSPLSLLFSSKKRLPMTRRLTRYSKMTLRAMLLSKSFHASCKVFLFFGILFALGYGSYLFLGKTFANDVVISKSEIISRVAKLIALPNEEPREIVRVQDPEDLMKQNEFYKDVKEGDYILMYVDLAVIYNLRDNQVTATKLTKK